MPNKFGRRKSLIITDIFTIFAVILTIVTKFNIIVFGRVALGLAVETNSLLIPLYNKEISPLELTGIIGCFHQLFGTIGCLVAFVLGSNLPSKNNSNYGSSHWW